MKTVGKVPESDIPRRAGSLLQPSRRAHPENQGARQVRLATRQRKVTADTRWTGRLRARRGAGPMEGQPFDKEFDVIDFDSTGVEGTGVPLTFIDPTPGVSP